MSTLLVILQAPAEAPILRLAKGALEAEATRRGLSLIIKVDASADCT